MWLNYRYQCQIVRLFICECHFFVWRSIYMDVTCQCNCFSQWCYSVGVTDWCDCGRFTWSVHDAVTFRIRVSQWLWLVFITWSMTLWLWYDLVNLKFNPVLLYQWVNIAFEGIPLFCDSICFTRNMSWSVMHCVWLFQLWAHCCLSLPTTWSSWGWAQVRLASSMAPCRLSASSSGPLLAPWLTAGTSTDWFWWCVQCWQVCSTSSSLPSLKGSTTPWWSIPSWTAMSRTPSSGTAYPRQTDLSIIPHATWDSRSLLTLCQIWQMVMAQI